MYVGYNTELYMRPLLEGKQWQAFFNTRSRSSGVCVVNLNPHKGGNEMVWEDCEGGSVLL